MVKNFLIAIITLVIIFFIIVYLYNWDQSRSIYCLTPEKCITVWKRLGGKCFIIPEKYFGRKRPTGAYIKTTNTDRLDVIWKNDNSILVNSKENAIYLQSTSKMRIKLYQEDKDVYDSLYTFLDGSYRKYREGVNFLSVDVKENYVRDNKGQKVLDLID
jgi:hypothetical protein